MSNPHHCHHSRHHWSSPVLEDDLPRPVQLLSMHQEQGAYPNVDHFQKLSHERNYLFGDRCLTFTHSLVVGSNVHCSFFNYSKIMKNVIGCRAYHSLPRQIYSPVGLEASDSDLE